MICFVIQKGENAFSSSCEEFPASFGRSLPGAIHDQELVFEEKRFSDYGTDACAYRKLRPD
jgi:hypothetical protein